MEGFGPARTGAYAVLDNCRLLPKKWLVPTRACTRHPLATLAGAPPCRPYVQIFFRTTTATPWYWPQHDSVQIAVWHGWTNEREL